jgi:membrane-associated phospholipid phosphatase
MSGGLRPVAADCGLARLRWARANVVQYFSLFLRKPRSAARSTERPADKPAATPMWRTPRRLGIGAVAVGVIVAAVMIVADAPAVAVAQGVPVWLIEVFDQVTDFGKSVWFLVPIALALVALALFASPALPRISRRVLAALAVRLGFLFLAIGLPGLIFTIVKRLIGRARPLVEGSADPFIYRPLSWNVEYASLPSGHATDAFAAAMAVGALWPRARPLMWSYAVVIALSRVVLTAHFPSDVVVGAVVGTVGALLVRDWFAARGLGFSLGPDGGIRPFAGPSLARIKRVAGQLLAP